MGKIPSPIKTPERKLEDYTMAPINSRNFNHSKTHRFADNSTQFVRLTKFGRRIVTKGLPPKARSNYPLPNEQSKRLISDTVSVQEISRFSDCKNNTFVHNLSRLRSKTVANFPEAAIPRFLPKRQGIEANEDLELKADETEPFWRGVFVVPHQPKILFSQEMELKPNKPSNWKRHVVIDISRLEDDDE